MSTDLNTELSQDINASKRNRLLFVIAITTVIGSIIMPHDSMVSTIASKYIFPAVSAGICFGVAIFAAINLWQLASAEKTAEKKVGK